MDNRQLYSTYVDEINRQLNEYLSDDWAGNKKNPEKKLNESMRYSLLAGGKRIRAVMALAFCQACGGNYKNAIPFACALEMVHTYSLIFDDLPCMDNDDLRRGKPTNHIVFGEDMSLMAGMGLYSRSFDILLNNDNNIFNISKEQVLEGMNILVRASGRDGIVGGQVLDMANNGGDLMTGEDIELIHMKKTGAMFEAACVLGCLAAGTDDDRKNDAREYAKNIGLSFQIRDDILDVLGDSSTLGKSIGKDKTENKTTFVDILGIKKAQALVEEYSSKADSCLGEFRETGFLKYLTGFLIERNY